MRRNVVAFLCLVALSATANVAAEEQTIFVQIGDTLTLGQYESNRLYEVTNCHITTKNGDLLEFYPKNKANEEKLKRYGYFYKKCEIKVPDVNVEDEGKWSTRTTMNVTKDGKLQSLATQFTYNVQVRKTLEEKTAVPVTRTSVYPGQIVSVHFGEEFEALSSCQLLGPNRKLYDLESGKLAHITLSKQCGFKMNVQKEYGGKWTLLADLKNGSAFYTYFQVVVQDEEDLKPKTQSFYFKRGDTVNIDGGRQMENAQMCILVDPHGVKYPITSGPCEHKITFVTEHHAGVWKAYYGMTGIEDLVEQKIIVEIYDTLSLSSNVTRSPNGDINLLCQVRSRSTKYCSFIRPDGTILHMTFAVGNDKYEYYGNGQHSQERYLIGSSSITDCGVTIHKPDINDYGSWRCLINTSLETLGTVLKVTPSARSHVKTKSTATAKDVYAKRYASYTIKCTADEVFSYCWLRSPNGTVYNVQKGDSSDFTYGGVGLELGDCTVNVKRAEESHAGQWSCHMGIFNGPEVEANFNVHLKDSYLMASRDVILVSRNTNAELRCHPLPDSNKIIESCRWINPQGYGINVEYQGRYITETGTTNCILLIREIILEEDVGEWSCYAEFSSGNHEVDEGNARLLVTYRRYSISGFLMVTMVMSALASVGVGIFIFIIYRRRFLIMHQDEKVILKKPPKYP